MANEEQIFELSCFGKLDSYPANLLESTVTQEASIQPTLPLIMYLLLLRFNQHIDQKASVHFRVSISGRWSQPFFPVAANNILI